MKKLMVIAVCLLTFAACTKSGSGSGTGSASDTTYNGSYFYLTYNGGTVNIRGLSVSNPFYETVLSTSAVNAGTGFTYYEIVGTNAGNVGGLHTVSMQFVYTGTGTGTYPIYNTAPSDFIANLQDYFDTSGTVTVSYSGSDYIQGTFSITMYGSGLSIPATGSFKIMH